MARSTDASGMNGVNSNSSLSTPDTVQDQFSVSSDSSTAEHEFPSIGAPAEIRVPATTHPLSDTQPVNDRQQEVTPPKVNAHYDHARDGPVSRGNQGPSGLNGQPIVATNNGANNAAGGAAAQGPSVTPSRDGAAAAPVPTADTSNEESASTGPVRKPTPSRSKAAVQAVPTGRGGGSTPTLPILPPPALTLVSSALLAAGGTVPLPTAGSTGGRGAGTKCVTAASLINAASAPAASLQPIQKVMRSSLSSCGLSSALAAAAAAAAGDGQAAEGGSLGGRTASDGSSDTSTEAGSTYSSNSCSTKGKAGSGEVLVQHATGGPQQPPSSGCNVALTTTTTTAAAGGTCATSAVDPAAITAAVAASKLGLTSQLTTALTQHVGLAKAR
jgi:hypothetical protein